MKNKYLIIIALILFAPEAKSQSLFTKEYHNYKIDTSLSVTVLYKNSFYCLRSDNQIFIINSRTNSIDSSYKDNSKSISLLNIYLRNDTLIGLNRNNSCYLDTAEHKWVFLKKGVYKAPFYEDERFLLTSTCSGEWGGSLYFRDKSTNQLYECQCTCAVNVHKNNGNYIVTASLAHKSGFANVFEVADPLKLKKYDRSNLKGKKVVYVGDDESKSVEGTKQVIDSVGIEIATSFTYNTKIYYLTEKFKKVSIDTIENKKLKPVEDLTNLNIWADYPENRVCFDHQVTTFENQQKTGFIDIDKNKLSFYIFDIKHK